MFNLSFDNSYSCHFDNISMTLGSVWCENCETEKGGFAQTGSQSQIHVTEIRSGRKKTFFDCQWKEDASN